MEKFIQWTVTDLVSESDVEQKFIYPLLVAPNPYGLSLSSSTIKTKHNIKKYQIDKGVKEKTYFPDYLLVDSGFPFMVIEAKKPTEDIDEGYREARLYAGELNHSFPHNLNPVKYIIATNGVEILVGYNDQTSPLLRFKCDELDYYSESFNQILEVVGFESISKYLKSLEQLQVNTGFYKVRRLLGGGSIQDEEIAVNDFATTVTSTIANYFSPKSLEDRKKIVEEAYVPSKRRERYVDPIDRVIRAVRPPSELNSITLQNTQNPKEILDKLADKKSLENKVLLIVGSVGSGKSTFVDYLQMRALPKESIESTVWCRLNMNNAPVNNLEIYSWLRKKIVEACRDSLPDVDFDTLETIKKIYGSEIAKFDKGIGSLYKNSELDYNRELARFLQEKQNDEQLEAFNHVKFTSLGREKLCIIVLDNCDKKDKSEQLLMFQVAQWLQSEFKSLVIMPMRDETFDNNRYEPPLDTVLKDMVFRIEPPLFQHVLTERIALALRGLNSGNEKLQYKLPNGIRVNYPKSEQAFYLISILKSLFEYDRFARRLIVGLAGRDIRKALEIFMDFCRSGYISEDYILKIRQQEGNYKLPLHLVATVLLRMNRRYYDGDRSYVKNIFEGNIKDTKINYFARFLILKWLHQRFKEKGDSRVNGYFKKETIKNHLVVFGLSPNIMDREIEYLLKSFCIVTESLRTDSCLDEDLVRIAPAGFVHLDLIENVNYLSALAEDTYFPDRETAEMIVDRIKNDIEYHMHVKTTIKNADTFLNFLEDQKNLLLSLTGSYTSNTNLELMLDFKPSHDSIGRLRLNKSYDPWFDPNNELQKGSKHLVTVVNIYNYGCLVEFSSGVIGLLHEKYLKGIDKSSIELGDQLNISIISVDLVQKKINVQFESLGDSHMDILD